MTSTKQGQADPRYTVILVDETGNYKLERERWEAAEWKASREGEVASIGEGVVAQLRASGSYLAFIPPSLRISNDDVCALVNLQALLRNNPAPVHPPDVPAIHQATSATVPQPLGRMAPAPDTGSPSCTLIVIGDDGRYYKLEQNKWRTHENLMSDARGQGVIKELVEFGCHLAFIPPDIAVGIGHFCTLVNLKAILRPDFSGQDKPTG
jgi:hypothetical protein